ncbi:MAG: GNAT family N-acetyltransferase [bacterium]
MSQSLEARPNGRPPLRPLLETDRAELVRYLRQSPEENVYLLSRIALDGVVNEESVAHGRFYGQWQEDSLRGVAFFGHRKGLTLTGDSPEFLRGVTDLALGAESDWIVLVGPRGPVEGFLSHYRWRGRAMHLNRLQDFQVLTADTLGECGAAIRRAEPRDLEDVVEMSEQMLREDFDLPAGSLSREGIRESMRLKIRDGRTWVLDDAVGVVFKADVSAQYAGGAQIEGVFTRPDARGRGFARRGMGALSAELLRSSQFVTLHVDQRNDPARRAYERAGFRTRAEFRLVLLAVAPR